MVYGKTSDHILELKTVLLDGKVLDSGPVSLEQAETIAQGSDRVAKIYRQVIDTCVGEEHLIADKFPPLNRFLTGYDLKHAYDPKSRLLMFRELLPVQKDVRLRQRSPAEHYANSQTPRAG